MKTTQQLTLPKVSHNKTIDYDTEITLLTIYDKGEISSVSSKFIKWLIAQVNS